MKSRKSSNFGQIGPLTLGLSALEHLKNTPIDLKRRKWCLHSYLIVFNPILLILAGNEIMH